MLSNMLLRNSWALLGKNALRGKNSVQLVRGCHVAATPARNKLSLTENVMNFVLVFAAMTFYPFWIVFHIRDYQGLNRNEYIGN